MLGKKKKSKITINYLLNFYTSTISSLSNFSNSYSKFISLSRNSNKLKGDLHPILGPIFVDKNQLF